MTYELFYSQNFKIPQLAINTEPLLLHHQRAAVYDNVLNLNAGVLVL